LVLETRDIEDSATIFGFPVSNHKKSTALFKNISNFFPRTYSNNSAIFGARDLKFLPKIIKKIFYKQILKKNKLKKFDFF